MWPLVQFRESLTTRRAELAALGATVDGAALMAQVIESLDRLLDEEHAPKLTLREASRLGGYSEDHLGRMVKDGRIPNAGRPNAPKISLPFVPRKPGHLPPASPPSHVSTTKTQIVRSLISSRKARPDHG